MVDTDIVRAAKCYRDNIKNAFLLHSGCPKWTEAEYKVNYPDSLDRRRFSAMFSDGRIRTIFDRRSAGRDTNMCACEWHWTSLKSLCAGYFCPIGLSFIAFERHTNKVEYLPKIYQVRIPIRRFSELVLLHFCSFQTFLPSTVHFL